MIKKIILLISITGISLLSIYFINKSKEDDMAVMMEVPEFSLSDENGKLISPTDLTGKVIVVEFFFTNCPTICPVMNQNLKEVISRIEDPDFVILSISIDPKRDTPDILKAYKTKLGIQNSNWIFLTGERENIYALSKKFNIYVGKDENNSEGLHHSGKVALIDKMGKLRCRFRENGEPILYYSILNYSDEAGKKMSLSGTFHPERNYLEEDIHKLLNENN